MPRKAGGEALSCWQSTRGDLWKELFDFHLLYLDPGVSRIYSLLAAALRVLPQVTAILLSNYPGEGRLAEMAGRICRIYL